MEIEEYELIEGYEYTDRSFLYAEYPFILPNVFLIARVNRKSLKQHLVIENRSNYFFKEEDCMKEVSAIKPVKKIENMFYKVLSSNSIDCIHTAVMDISTSDLEYGAETENRDLELDEGFQKDILKLRSSENLREIKLPLEEKYKAFKSWVCGIASAGMESFKIQAEIEAYAKLMYPISNTLLRFMISVDPQFIPMMLEKIERECKYEGVLHEASFIANIIPVLMMVKEMGNSIKNKDQIMEMLIEMKFPLSFFPKHPEFKELGHTMKKIYKEQFVENNINDSMILEDFNAGLSSQQQIISVIGNVSSGKTEFIEYYLNKFQNSKPIYMIGFDKELTEELNECGFIFEDFFDLTNISNLNISSNNGIIFVNCVDEIMANIIPIDELMNLYEMGNSIIFIMRSPEDKINNKTFFSVPINELNFTIVLTNSLNQKTMKNDYVKNIFSDIKYQIFFDQFYSLEFIVYGDLGEGFIDIDE